MQGRPHGNRSSEVGVQIDEIRKRIDLLDDVLLRIFNERARLALQIGHLKKGTGLPVFDPAREKRILTRMKEDNPGPLDSIKEYLINHGFDIHQSTGANRTIIGVIGDTGLLDVGEIEALPGVSQVVRIKKDD
jgi:chorismate mutase